MPFFSTVCPWVYLALPPPLDCLSPPFSLYLLRCTNLYVPPHQAAADYVKAHLPEALRQQLQAFERERKESSQSYASILEQRIMAVDRDMLDKLSANHDEAGQEPGMIGGAYILGHGGDDMGV